MAERGPSLAGASKVRVAVRIRPLTSNEIRQGGNCTLDVSPPSIGIGQRQFTYDKVFDSPTGQLDLYESISAPMLKSFIDGYNATIMAYGQTGSGKTFTMGSEAHLEPESSSHTGLIPRFMSDFFLHLQKKKEASDVGQEGATTLLEYGMSASFLEVYGEDVYDLLDEGRKSLPLREDSNGGVVIAGLTSRAVATAAEALEVLHEGTMNRTTAATLMNLTSSRSHAVFTIALTQMTRSESCRDMDVTTTSKFTFVDLAGSERMKKTGAEGERAREGIKINEGLLALGNVINALADEERLAKEKKIHVPYRQSKLTRLLQDALGGNSQTLFLACVSPSDTNASETLSTLHYANRARNIRNAPTKNMDATAAEIQRLHALTRVLQCELIKQRFQNISNGEEKIGEVDDELLQRKEVLDYLQQLIDAVNESQEGHSSYSPIDIQTTSKVQFTTSPAEAVPQIQATPAVPHVLDSVQNTTISERIDDSFLVDVNPDEDMAILDKLLQLQQHDHDYDKQNRRDTLQLKQMEGELEKQEAMLLHLRDSVKGYHSMKEKFEVLMTEVQHLENEKATLAEQLENSAADPSKGCSAAIKRKLEKVEASLARAREETRKHRDKFRKAEQEAQKCRALERKISDLKHAKVSLMKKQKEAAAKYRDLTESKTRELLILKRKEKAAGQRVSKLETEVRQHKANLQKRKSYCDKLSEKLKQTESHLMKLLSMRKREVSERASRAGSNRRRISDYPIAEPYGENDEQFAPSNEEIKSMKFILDKMVAEKVSQENLKIQYEDRMAAYSDTMREIMAEIELLNEERQNPDGKAINDWNASIREREDNVADLELKLELVSSELKALAAKLPQEKVSHLDGDEAVKKIMSSMTAPVLRTLLMETFSRYSEAEIDRQRSAKILQRKETALSSFESEVETLNNRIAMLSKDLSDHRVFSDSGEDPIAVIKSLEVDKASLNAKLQTTAEKLETANAQIQKLEKETRSIEQEHAKTKESLVIAQLSLDKQNRELDGQEAVEKLQEIWNILGVDATSRESSRRQIERCLEDTCERKLNEAVDLKQQTDEKIKKTLDELNHMEKALGIAQSKADDSNGSPLLEYLETLQVRVKQLKPQYNSAFQQREKIVKEACRLSMSLGLSYEQLSANLRTLIGQKTEVEVAANRQRRAVMMSDIKEMVNALSEFESIGHDSDSMGEDDSTVKSSPRNDVQSTEPYKESIQNLQGDLLEGCEKEVTALQVQKSEILVRNGELQRKASSLVREMHMSVEETIALVSQKIQRNFQGFPDWWAKDTVEQVARVIDVSGGTVEATNVFSQHLQLILETLEQIARGRRSLSNALRSIVERAQKTLLDIVGRELDASEAYASFHDALFRLPALSKELSDACITEMDALVAGVEAMTQSEIEALTLIWEALNVSSTDRRSFWGEVDDPSTGMEKKGPNPFEEAVRSTKDAETWVRDAVKKATKGYRELDRKLFKLDRIHQEVERLRLRQDSKSRIISLDSELRILNAKLSEFEDMKCNKQRLLTKKAGSSTLLKEERFRKQMQGKYTAKLEQLAGLLRSWSEEENKLFDASLLSDDVRHLLDDPDQMETWVKQRTKFMPLRTISTKTPARKRPIDEAEIKPPRSRSALRSTRDGNVMSPPRKRAASQSATNANPSTRKGGRKPKLRNIDAPTRVTRSTTLASRKRTEDESRHRDASTRDRKSPCKTTVKSALLPFGHLLSESSSPIMESDKENSHSRH